MTRNARGRLSLSRAAVVTVVAVLGFRSFVGRPMRVVGHSMKPTLADGELAWADVLGAHLRSPRLGDVVVIHNADREPMVKRVVGVGGDTVEVREGIVYRNGSEVAGRPLSRVANWEDAGDVLPLRALFAERFEEDVGGVHVVQRFSSSASTAPVHVPEEHVFVLGDNRDDSIDSRAFGCVPVAAIEARVVSRAQTER
jgi:signal peptidase I